MGCLIAPPELDEKIKLRAPYVVPLNILQVGFKGCGCCGVRAAEVLPDSLCTGLAQGCRRIWWQPWCATHPHYVYMFYVRRC